jgi:ketosteroid isomerase-like protein
MHVHSTARAEQLAARDVAFDAAVCDAAVDLLDPLLALDFVYTHTGGQRQTRAEFLASVATRRGHAARRLSAISVEIHGRLAVTFGDLTISYQSGRADHHLRYVRVHRYEGGAWSTIFHRTFEALDRRPGFEE